jgi:hypothetical protein
MGRCADQLHFFSLHANPRRLRPLDKRGFILLGIRSSPVFDIDTWVQSLSNRLGGARGFTTSGRFADSCRISLPGGLIPYLCALIAGSAARSISLHHIMLCLTVS